MMKFLFPIDSNFQAMNYDDRFMGHVLQLYLICITLMSLNVTLFCVSSYQGFIISQFLFSVVLLYLCHPVYTVSFSRRKHYIHQRVCKCMNHGMWDLLDPKWQKVLQSSSGAKIYSANRKSIKTLQCVHLTYV